mmetsp:Transcript_117525/g.332499  ORF Transcript_117525/g.332499 Transcript_117525/m.332499 type:complete len:213 (+) Transcript_117525:80-718(+)
MTIFGLVSTNSPKDVSSVKPTQPPPTVMTSSVEHEYNTYPAATSSLPGCSVPAKHCASLTPISERSNGKSHVSPSDGSLKMPKIVPTAMPASTLLLPSRGSKTQTYCPESTRPGMVSSASAPATGESSSSDASVTSLPVYIRAFLRTSLVMTSSFFWSSPCTLISPWNPSSSACASGALFTSFAITFEASEIELRIDSISVSNLFRLESSIK